MGSLKLYKHSHIGTKDLIERYITSALDTLDALLDVSERAGCDGAESKHILEQVLKSRQAFGRSALLLSGGATFGMNHIGVIKTLWEARLLPRIISGASAGSIVCAVLCTRTDEEMPDVIANFCNGDLAVFEEEGNEDRLYTKVVRFLKYGALFDISHLTRVMRDLLGDMTFQEGYNRTRRILNVCVSSASLYELPRLLNYVTAPNVLIWSAVAASCSVPFLFSPAPLLAKDPKTGEFVPWNASPQRWIDGSVDNDLPMTRLAEMFNVNHFVVSQVNPHVVPFLIKEEDILTQETQDSSTSWLHSVSHLAKGEALHRMHIMAEMGIFPNTLTKAVSVLSQKYSGDITIFPEISYSDFPRMLSNPTVEFMEQAMLCGERSTWPKLSRIKNHCAIELALDDAVQKLRARVVFSPSQIDLRFGYSSRSTSEVKIEGHRGRGKGSRSKRKMSQNSLPEPTSKNIQNNRAPNRKQAHGKTQSANTLLISTDFTTEYPSDIAPQATKLPRAPIPASAPFIHPFPEILSSEADTSNVTTSDSETDVSSSFTSESYPPTSPTNAPLHWPGQDRHLFPFASQPTTPGREHPGTTHLPRLSTTSSAISPGTIVRPSSKGDSNPMSRPQSLSAPHSPNSRSSIIAMTPTDSTLNKERNNSTATIVASPIPVRPSSRSNTDKQLPQRPSSPELKYKRLFHHGHTGSGARKARASEPAVVPQPSITSAKSNVPRSMDYNSGGSGSDQPREGMRRFNALGFEIDIPTSRGQGGLVMGRARRER